MSIITPETLIIDKHYININNGLCIYRGTRENNGITNYVFEYANSESLWLSEIYLKNIREYGNGSASTSNKKLNKLNDNTSWVKTKFKESERASQQAKQLLDLYVARSQVKGFVFKADTDAQREFEDAFIYEATVDQLQAVRDIKRDLESGRILSMMCIGDVGSGKSEVYSRACFKAVDNGYQVAILLPSSILANQCYIDTVERFKNFPNIKIVLFSRDNSAKTKREILEQVKSGGANIIIGTTAICSDNVIYKNLNLLIVDESHLLGVQDKTKLQKYENKLNVLYLSATPLPAELFKTLAGIYDVVKLTTMPKGRKDCITKVYVDSDEVIKDAIDRELKINGQVFIVYNNVSKLEGMKERLLNINPNLRIGIVNGQMDQKEAKTTMVEFKNYELDILLATTIVEVGINVPNASTIIVIGSQNFGLSSLHQLRGRSLRSSKQGYCYLLYNKDIPMQQKATERLNIMEKNSTLTSGFAISEADRLLRGDGDFMLKQSGKLSSIGYSLYREILEKSIQEQKNNIDNNIDNNVGELNFNIAM
jgi:transcription-repair coupling factor (superfamily II helicase)